MLDLILKKAGSSEPGFARKIVKWAITCTSEGRFTGVVPLADGKGQEFQHCPSFNQPELVGGEEARSHFLSESLPTVVLYWKDDLEEKDQNKYHAKHEYFYRLLERASKSAPYLAVAANLLADETILAEIRADLKKQRAKPTETATFLIDGINPLELDDWHDWWREFRQGLKKSEASTMRMRCMVTGELVEPAGAHPKIKGLAGVGGLSMGDVLAGCDKPAFQSYGLEKSQNAAMSEETATAYTETLNQLIAKKSVKLGNKLLVTYWFSARIFSEDNILSWIVEPPEQTEAAAELKARNLLRAIHEGKRSDLVNNSYVSLVLSGNAGRVMVREVMQGTFEELVSNVERWFSDLSMVDREGRGLTRNPKFFSVVNAIEFLSKDGKIVRNIDDVPPPLIHEMWRSAITGSQIPSSAMSRTLMRIRSDIVSGLPPLEIRFSIIKSYLLRKGDDNMQSNLNPEHPHPAYHCGRLLAVFARLQRAALGDVGAGVVQRYYTAASQTPGLIMGRLAANAKNHLGKLEGGLVYWYEDQIAKIMDRIKDIVPRTLTLEEQSLFALGYYQQIASLNTGKGEKQKDAENNDFNKEEENK